MKQRENVVQVRINVNADTKKKFDAACAREGLTMTAVIERFMEQYVSPATGKGE